MSGSQTDPWLTKINRLRPIIIRFYKLYRDGGPSIVELSLLSYCDISALPGPFPTLPTHFLGEMLKPKKSHFSYTTYAHCFIINMYVVQYIVYIFI